MEHLEIERKFLVKSNNYKAAAISKNRIVQGFLNTHPERTVRVRITEEKGFLTVKGMGNDSGTTRFEWETEISLVEATNLIDLCEPVILEKVRFKVPVDGAMFEVDEFLGGEQRIGHCRNRTPTRRPTFSKAGLVGEGSNR